MQSTTAALFERQQREIEYHRAHAKLHGDLLGQAFSYDVLFPKSRRWWNAYWEMYAFLTKVPLAGKNVLIVGCGFGDDALRIAKLGANVFAFDISVDSLSIARALALREGLVINFGEMAAEKLDYPNDFFDCVIARDILHHVDIPHCMREIVRVSKHDSLFLVNEIYSHSITKKIRHARIVEKYIYPTMQKFIYGNEKPYITEDERKLTEEDIELITQPIDHFQIKKYFNFLVTRIIPDEYEAANKLDRFFLMLIGPIASWLSGRILFAGSIRKSHIR